MNDHEAERIAHAMHALRPDWPTASVLTLIRSKLIDRPRRDVIVALGWVAAEPASHTPARVLEAGPWWKAAGIEASAASTPRPSRGPWCALCGYGKDDPKHPTDDHDFTERPNGAPSEDVRAAVRELLAAAEVRLARTEKTTQPTGETLADHDTEGANA